MDEIQNQLIELSDNFDKCGKTVCANTVDGLLQSGSLQKIAQYVGVIGYVLKQNRAMGNCVRKKRAESDRPSQEIVMECLKEYQDGQSYQNTSWSSKYAQVIENEPSLFDVSHLYLLDDIGRNNEMDSHLDTLSKAAEVLSANNETDNIVVDTFNNIKSLGEILAKESQSADFFKFAAPSKRNWLSRLWTPGWTERGQDADTIFGMKKVLEELTRMENLSQKVKTSIYRAKHEVQGYTSGSHQNLPQQDTTDSIGKIVQRVNELSPDDWNKTVLNVQQLQFLLRETNLQNPYNKEILGRINNLVTSTRDGMDSLYKSIDSLQDLVAELRNKNPIMGRGSKKQDPTTMISPAEEMSALERVLSILYRNPLDEKAVYYAKKMHERLWDKLRYIEREIDPEASDWLRQKDQPYNPVSVAPQEPTAPAPVNTGAPAAPAARPTANPEINRGKIDQTVDALRSMNMPITQIKELIGQISLILDDPSDKQILNEIQDNLATVPGTNQTSTAPPAAAAAATTTPPAQPSTATPAKAPVATESPAAAPQSSGQPAAENPRRSKIPTRGLERPDRRHGGFTQASSNSIFDVIKIADQIDCIDPKISNIFDKFIIQQANTGVLCW